MNHPLGTRSSICCWHFGHCGYLLLFAVTVLFKGVGGIQIRGYCIKNVTKYKSL